MTQCYQQMAATIQNLSQSNEKIIRLLELKQHANKIQICENLPNQCIKHLDQPIKEIIEHP